MDTTIILPQKQRKLLGFLGYGQLRKKLQNKAGGGKRDRWIDSKGRRIYEWDSQHGELEVYRVSDGEHLCSVDYKTGKELKPAVKGRNIKQYL
ncbi:putative cytotoxic protein [Photorhabdus temperata subsp. temperata M1021]|nr:colicin E3/pyocin S6 family cytotoxin [Photorhabdus temperata]EQC00701.1 putative cytotoxic protein [Photorhabdus temperata subsp. temperata M1021]